MAFQPGTKTNFNFPKLDTLQQRILSSTWIKGPLREHWMPSVYALGKAYTKGLTKFGVLPQEQSLIHFKDGFAQIYRPKEEFEKTIQSISLLIHSNTKKTGQSEIPQILKNHAQVNKEIVDFALQEVPSSNSQSAEWLTKLFSLLQEFYEHYIFNVFLLLALEKTGESVEWMSEAELLRNQNHYFTIEQLLAKYCSKNGIPKNYACYQTIDSLKSFDSEKEISCELILYFVNGEPIQINPNKTKLISKLCLGSEPMSKNISLNKNYFGGIITCKGIARGIAKIIYTREDCKKILPKDIVVAIMATPEVSHHFHSISGIVTDEGGQTCHAAIISREFNIPCIVGTKVATKVLRDGDEIEVDANQGIVRILKKY